MAVRTQCLHYRPPRNVLRGGGLRPGSRPLEGPPRPVEEPQSIRGEENQRSLPLPTTLPNSPSATPISLPPHPHFDCLFSIYPFAVFHLCPQGAGAGLTRCENHRVGQGTHALSYPHHTLARTLKCTVDAHPPLTHTLPHNKSATLAFLETELRLLLFFY